MSVLYGQPVSPDLGFVLEGAASSTKVDSLIERAAQAFWASDLDSANEHLGFAEAALNSIGDNISPKQGLRYRYRIELARVRVAEVDLDFVKALKQLVDILPALQEKPYQLEFATALLLKELIHEQTDDYAAAATATSKVRALVSTTSGLRAILPYYYIRAASLARVSDNEVQFSASLVDTALLHAREQNSKTALADGYFLQSMFVDPDARELRIELLSKAAYYSGSVGNARGQSYILANIARTYEEWGLVNIALRYIDSTLILTERTAKNNYQDGRYLSVMYDTRARLLMANNQKDSAFSNLQKAKALSEEFAADQRAAELASVQQNFDRKQSDARLREQRTALTYEQRQRKLLSLAAGTLGLLAGVLGFFVWRLSVARKRITAEKDLQHLLRGEMQHRVKNNLQILIALLEQGEDASDSSETVAVLKRLAGQVHGLATVHRLLDQHDGAHGVDANTYLTEIVMGFRQTFDPQKVLRVRLDAANVALSAKTLLPLGLILHELLINTLKHASAPAEGLTANIIFEPDLLRPATLMMSYQDNGKDDVIAFRQNIGTGPAEISSNKGYYLVESMSRQLRGALSVPPAKHSGLSVIVRFPQPPMT